MCDHDFDDVKLPCKLKTQGVELEIHPLQAGVWEIALSEPYRRHLGRIARHGSAWVVVRVNYCPVMGGDRHPDYTEAIHQLLELAFSPIHLASHVQT